MRKCEVLAGSMLDEYLGATVITDPSMKDLENRLESATEDMRYP